MIADFKKITEAQGLGTHPDETIIVTHQKINTVTEIEIDGTHVEILPPGGRVKYFGANDHIRGSRNHRGTAQDPMCPVRIRQTSTGTDIPDRLTTTQVTPV